MPKNETPLYPYSHREAEWSNCLDRWWESFMANRDCAREIQSALTECPTLPAARFTELLDQWGWKRTEYVMANTVRFMHANALPVADTDLVWARGVYIPPDEGYNHRFAVDSPAEKITAFMSQLREARQKLGLFGAEQCDSGPRDYTGKVLVMDPKILSEQYWAPEFQLWYAETGFGCNPESRGRAVFATALFDGEEARWNRQDFLGVIREECLPGWAKEKLEEIQAQRQAQNTMTM